MPDLMLGRPPHHVSQHVSKKLQELMPEQASKYTSDFLSERLLHFDVSKYARLDARTMLRAFVYGCR